MRDKSVFGVIFSESSIEIDFFSQFFCLHSTFPLKIEGKKIFQPNRMSLFILYRVKHENLFLFVKMFRCRCWRQQKTFSMCKRVGFITKSAFFGWFLHNSDSISVALSRTREASTWGTSKLIISSLISAKDPGRLLQVEERKELQSTEFSLVNPSRRLHRTLDDEFSFPFVCRWCQRRGKKSIRVSFLLSLSPLSASPFTAIVKFHRKFSPFDW